jgi:hypothetical protein
MDSNIMPKQIPVTEFDILTQPDYIQLIKAILPFMEYNMQRRVSALIRTSELKNTIRFYNSPANCNIFKTCSNSSGITFNTPINEILNNEKLMNTITTYCSGNIINMINTYRSFSKMSDMFNMMDMFNGSFNGNQANRDSGYSSDGNSNNQYFNSGNYMANDVNSGNNSSGNNILNNFMNSNQRDLYNEYLRQLDSLDLNFNSDDNNDN